MIAMLAAAEVVHFDDVRVNEPRHQVRLRQRRVGKVRAMLRAGQDALHNDRLLKSALPQRDRTENLPPSRRVRFGPSAHTGRMEGGNRRAAPPHPRRPAPEGQRRSVAATPRFGSTP